VLWERGKPQLMVIMMSDQDYRICHNCISDTTIPGIEFDDTGVCNYCHEFEERNNNYPLNEEGEKRLQSILRDVIERGKGHEYDCVIGASGGTDSTYCLYLAKQWGLRPLAVHFDNGWNTNVAVSNIKRATDKLGIDLFTHVVDWEEFKDLQVAFLKASVPDADAPTDVAIQSVLYDVAIKEKIRYIINGSNFRTEGNQPPAWGYGDGKYISSVYRKYGKNKKIRHTPNHTLSDIVYYHFIKGLKFIKPLYYIDYQKAKAMEVLKNELGWEYYGGHHYENIYTRFVHGYYLPAKFGIDKRKIEFSALIRSRQMTREDALNRLKDPTYDKDLIKDDIGYVISKLGLSEDEFVTILSSENKRFANYDTYYPLIVKGRHLINLAHRLRLYPDKVYGKYSY
jgi:N-acetyl sugar amidotransferase